MATIREYYHKIDDFTWKCSICGKVVRSKTTSNLLQHFRANHQNIFDAYSTVAKRKPKPVLDVTPAKRGRPSSSSQVVSLTLKRPHRDEQPTVEELPFQDENIIQHTEEEENDFDEWGDPKEEEEDSSKVIFVPPEQHATTEYHGEPSYSRPLPVSTTEDPLKLFFQSMYGSVSRLPPEDIFNIRRRIFDVVCEYEEQQLINRVNKDIHQE